MITVVYLLGEIECYFKDRCRNYVASFKIEPENEPNPDEDNDRNKDRAKIGIKNKKK